MNACIPKVFFAEVYRPGQFGEFQHVKIQHVKISAAGAEKDWKNKTRIFFGI